MKTILLAFCMLTFTATAQVPTDKVAHFGAGYIVGSLTTGLTLAFSNGQDEWGKSMAAGVCSAFVVGVGKELYDQKYKAGWDSRDLLATVLGGALSSVTLKLTIDGWKRKNCIKL